ncbi:competence protein CoiA [Companilactobacillus halodurans]|nr:competence protein CoiA family protein [Companilactobacillus halodurans]
MYAALDDKGRLIYAKQARLTQSYLCCHCAQKVKLIKTAKKSYFKHQSKRHNEINERAVHFKGKAIIHRELTKLGFEQILDEVYLPIIKQPPDLFLNQKIAFEYQCAKLDLPTFEKRVQGYRSLGIKSIWILGQAYLNRRLKREHLKFISYNQKLGYHLVMLDAQKELLLIFYNISFVGPFNKIYFQKRILSANDWQKFVKSDFQLKTNCLQRVDERVLERIRRKNDPESQKVKLQFYQRHKIPVETYLLNQTFCMTAPIYRFPAWQRSCGQKNILLRQPLLDKK